MEQENRGVKQITWKDLIERIEELKLDKSLKYYGVPRGGQPIAALLNPVDTPEDADIIIDDLIESGATKKRYKEKYPDKQFIALFHKTAGEEWLVFPWEVEEAPAEDNMVRILEFLNEDPNREGLMETPKRYLKFMKEFLSPPEFNFTCFTNDGTDDMIVQKNIPFYSLCEHHLAPFFGVAHVAYIPKGKIVGLSKLARTVELYARRLQNQERITHLVAERLMKELNPLGVAVVLEAEHLCMAMRGVKKHGVTTITSKMLGPFFDDPKSRSEFMDLIKN